MNVQEGIVPQNTLWINDEKPTEGNTHFLDEDTVVSGDLHVAVC